MQVEYIKCYSLTMTNYPIIGVSGSHDTFLISPNHIFETGEARHFKFRVQIHTQKYKCMHDVLPPKGMRLESRYLFIF